MKDLHIIVRHTGNRALSWSLAHDISSAVLQGKVAVVAKSPTALLPSTRKQWLRLLRQAQRKRASTLDAERQEAIDKQIAYMRNVTFTREAPDDLLEADVTFADADAFVRIPPICPTVVVTYRFEREKLHMLTSWLPKSSVVVIYE